MMPRNGCFSIEREEDEEFTCETFLLEKVMTRYVRFTAQATIPDGRRARMTAQNSEAWLIAMS